MAHDHRGIHNLAAPTLVLRLPLTLAPASGCWTKTPSVAAWLKARNMTADDGYAYFVKKAAEMVINLGKRPVQWVEVCV